MPARRTAVSDPAARLAAVKETLSIPEARRIALAAQGFGRPRPAAAGTRQLNLAIGRMATLQIDSVNVFARSHYMPLFSRVGPYDTAALDRLLFSRRAPYVEYWAHVASFIPAADWGLFRFRMDDMRSKYGTSPDGWFQTHREMVDWVRAELAERGPLRPAEIEHDAKKARARPVVGLGCRQERARVPVALRRGRDRGSPRVRAALWAGRAGACRPRSWRAGCATGCHPGARGARSRALRRGDGIRPGRLLAA